MQRHSKTTETKYLGFLTAVSRAGTFDGPLTVKNLKVNAALIAVMRKMGWADKTKKVSMYKYTGPTPSTESVLLLIEGVRKYGEESRRKVVLKKMPQSSPQLKVSPVEEKVATIIVDTNEQAALLAELAVRLGKKDIIGFIRQGQKSL